MQFYCTTNIIIVLSTLVITLKTSGDGSSGLPLILHILSNTYCFIIDKSHCIRKENRNFYFKLFSYRDYFGIIPRKKRYELIGNCEYQYILLFPQRIKANIVIYILHLLVLLQSASRGW